MTRLDASRFLGMARSLSLFGEPERGSWPQGLIGPALWSLATTGDRWQDTQTLMRLSVLPDEAVLRNPEWVARALFVLRVLRPLSWFGLVESRDEDATRRGRGKWPRLRCSTDSWRSTPRLSERLKARCINTDDSCRIMLGQGQAIKYGHTMVGSETTPCYSICFFENDYNPDTRTRCEVRPQGAHQQMPVHIWDYHSCPIEKKVTHALQRRQKVSDVIMGAYTK